MNYMTFPEFSDDVTRAGLTPHECSHAHWQILGGNYTVNFYPRTKKGSTYYINGMARGVVGDLPEAIKAARVGFRDQKRAERKTTRNTKKRLLAEDPHCHYCGCEVTWQTSHVDHKIPLSGGGSNGADNLVLACVTCDTKKRAKMPHTFIRGVRKVDKTT